MESASVFTMFICSLTKQCGFPSPIVIIIKFIRKLKMKIFTINGRRPFLLISRMSFVRFILCVLLRCVCCVCVSVCVGTGHGASCPNKAIFGSQNFKENAISSVKINRAELCKPENISDIVVMPSSFRLLKFSIPIACSGRTRQHTNTIAWNKFSRLHFPLLRLCCLHETKSAPKTNGSSK